ncbi:MAG: CopG family transcriptional regulator [Spirochaetes bacterium]|nr:CopG family transcriptional regulator [Spirochaetota bacterium]
MEIPARTISVRRSKDISAYLNTAAARRSGQKQKRVNVDFPVWMVVSLDRVAARLGIPRQSLIKVWIADRLDSRPARAGARGSNQRGVRTSRKR